MANANNKVRFLTPKPPKPERPLFVFLPGMDGGGLLLRSQIPKLANHFDIRCLAIPADDMASWEVLVSETIALIEAEKQAGKPKRPVYLCGESFGGCLAMKTVLEAPQIVRSINFSQSSFFIPTAALGAVGLVSDSVAAGQPLSAVGNRSLADISILRKDWARRSASFARSDASSTAKYLCVEIGVSAII